MTANSRGGLEGMSTIKRLQHFVAVCALPALVGCASPYTPYLADDAGKVRIRLTSTSMSSHVGGYFRSVVDEKCGPPVRFHDLSSYVERKPDQAPAAQNPAVAVTMYPRAAMVGSTDPERSDSIEFQMAPGRYLFLLLGGISNSLCGLPTAIDVDRNRQYDINFHINGWTLECRARSWRLEKQNGRSQWRAYSLVRGEVCTK